MSPSMWTWRVILPGLGLSVCALVFWQASLNRKADPRTTSRAVPLDPGSERVIAEGRIVARPGAEVVVGTESGGTVASVVVAEKARVKKGDLLIELRSDALKLELAEAEAKLGEADAELAFAQSDHQRKIQVKPSSTPQEREIESSRRDVQVAVARRKGVEAGVGRARLALSRARITTPIDGIVISSSIQPGEVVAPGARLITICDLTRLRIEAEVDEFDVERICQGDPVLIRVEGYDQATWKGIVEEVPDRVGRRTLIPDDPGRPTETRVLLVKIGFSEPIPIRLGQQVELEIRPKPLSKRTELVDPPKRR